jgi:hypothetical protein
MDGSLHYDKAEQFAREALDRLEQGDHQGAATRAALAQVHATLALAAAQKPDYEPPALPPDVRSGLISESEMEQTRRMRRNQAAFDRDPELDEDLPRTCKSIKRTAHSQLATWCSSTTTSTCSRSAARPGVGLHSRPQHQHRLQPMIGATTSMKSIQSFGNQLG